MVNGIQALLRSPPQVISTLLLRMQFSWLLSTQKGAHYPTLPYPTLPYPTIYLIYTLHICSIYKFGDNQKLRRFVERDSNEVTSHAPAYSPASLFVMVSRCWKMHTHSRALSYLRVGSEQTIPVWDSEGKLEQHKHLTRIELCFQFSIEFSLVFRWFFVGFFFQLTVMWLQSSPWIG